MLEDARYAITVLMEGQEAVWPVTTRSGLRSAPTWVTTPEDVFPLLGAVDYIAPWGFCEPKRDKTHVSPQGNLLWLDLDPPPGLTAEALDSHIKERRDVLLGLLPAPTLVVWSGRGEWMYWKLAVPIRVAEFERVNRLLPRIAGSSDTSSWSVEHWARLPGSINEKTGQVAAVRSISDARYEAGSLVDLIEVAAAQARVDVLRPDPAIGAGVGRASIATAATVPSIDLPPDLVEYVRANPTWDQAHQAGIDRSARDQAIIAHAFNQRCTDGEIKAWFEAHELRRYAEERDRGRGDSYLARSIEKARNGWKPTRAKKL